MKTNRKFAMIAIVVVLALSQIACVSQSFSDTMCKLSSLLDPNVVCTTKDNGAWGSNPVLTGDN